MKTRQESKEFVNFATWVKLRTNIIFISLSKLSRFTKKIFQVIILSLANTDEI